MKLRVCTLFSGYDSQCMALDRLKEMYPEFDYELVAWSEIDKYAIQAHNAIYPQWADRNYGDVSKIDWSQVPDFDLMTYSSPCQDFSQAGKQAGGEEGSGTRSSLLWEVRRAILAKKPKYMLMENVAALVSKKFIGQFKKWQLELSHYGYTNFSQVLNAKNYGVPQNRERIFMVSVLNCTEGYYFPTPIPLEKRLKDVLEKDVDERYYLKADSIDGYKLNEKQDVPIDLGWSRSREGKGDVINRHPVKVANCVTSGKRENTQNYVVEPINTDNQGNAATITAGYFKYGSKTLLGGTYGTSGTAVKESIVPDPMIYDDYNGRLREDQDTCGTLTTNCGNDAPRNGFKVIEHMIAREPQVMTPKRTDYGKAIRKQYEAGEIKEQRKNIQQLEPRNDGVSNTLTSVEKDNYVMIPEATKDGYIPMEIGGVCDLSYPNSNTRRGRVQDGGKVSPTLTCGVENSLRRIEYGYRIRKLTERECFRLMGVSEENIDKLIYHSGFNVWNGKKYVQVPRISKSRLYKLAGNSIVVDVMVRIFDQLLFGNKNKNQQLEIF